jgi:hypothetical protein
MNIFFFLFLRSWPLNQAHTEELGRASDFCVMQGGLSCLCYVLVLLGDVSDKHLLWHCFHVMFRGHSRLKEAPGSGLT